ncbi:anhydro-N-acetylmuramic acid kinase [Urechidicola sp. KH5]
MSEQIYKVIGLMSGTSLDGVDLVYVTLEVNGCTNFKIHKAATIPYSIKWMETLKTAFGKTLDQLGQLNEDYGKYLASVINDFIITNNIDEVDFIASHGHTIFHQPEKGITVQIGGGQMIANETGIKTIYDFRTQDVKLGGQGAPLVPIGDVLLFSDFYYCLNLGGFANISYDFNGERIAYDICPVNIVMNPIANTLGMPYDAFGKVARSGEIIPELLDELNALSFYKEPAPKSLGYEFVVTHINPLIEPYLENVAGVLRTFVEHCAMQIGAQAKSKGNLLVTGGGAFNTFLMERMKVYCAAQIVIPSDDLVNYKEALIFALLGVLKLNDKVNCLKSVSGASKDHSSGVIALPEMV